jgi:endonuclease/exonuclease/phosphatase family metal-dependent hydrolase
MPKRRRRPRRSVRSSIRRFRADLRRALWILAFLVTVGGVIAQQCGWAPAWPPSRRSLTASALPESGALRVATWNLRNFPGRGQDVQGIADGVRSLGASLVAVQEVKDADELRTRLPGKTLVLSKGGGRGHQRLGFAYDPAPLAPVGAPREHRELTAGGRVRPALTQAFEVRATGTRFDAIVVHLKAMPKGAALRQTQWAQLQDIVRRADRRVLVLGDFNPVGGEGRSAREELAALDRALAPADLTRIPVEDGCSAYWDGPRRDAWKEPSLLDLIFVRGFDAKTPLLAHAGGHCAAHACESLRSTDAYPDTSFETLSDHCPIHVDLPAAGRDISVTP